MRSHDIINFKNQQLRGGIRWEYANKSQVRKKLNESLYWEYNPPQRKINSLWEETCLAVQQICDRYEKPIKIQYSGGLDSEYVVRAFIEVAPRDSFELWHMHCLEDSIDEEYVRRFETEFDIKCNWVYLDWDEWINQQVFQDYISKIIPTAPIIATFQEWLALKMYEDKTGSVIICDGNPTVKNGYITEAEYAFQQIHFMEWQGIPGVGWFYIWSEELWYAQIATLDETKEELENKKRYGLEERPTFRVFDHINKFYEGGTVELFQKIPTYIRNIKLNISKSSHRKVHSIDFFHNIGSIKEFKDIIDNPVFLRKKVEPIYTEAYFKRK